MHTALLKSRDMLKKKLLNNVKLVINEALNMDLNNLAEIGIFGSLAKDSFTCKSDADIYFIFDGCLPDRQTKGMLRSIAEENDCDIVFVEKSHLVSENPSPLITEILNNRIILWRECDCDKK